MNITMHNTRNQSIAELKQFTSSTKALIFKAENKAETYRWTEKILRNTRYHIISKKDKGYIREYLEKVTGYSASHMDRLIRKYAATGRLILTVYQRNAFPRTYTDRDIILLARLDAVHGNLSGPATLKIIKDEYEMFRRQEFAILSGISVSHIYNLRSKRRYRETNRTFQKTKPTQVCIGIRKKPIPNGKPGFLRVDSVHTGDTANGEHGAYFINLVDEVTQWEIVLCVEAISERYLKAALQSALDMMPFVIVNFHADNGSEYINHTVAALLNKIHCGFTKSRPRRSNDNALVESKNGHVIRKHFGYWYIPRSTAGVVHTYCLRWFNPYLNFHRPCGFPEEVVVNKHGKIKKRYPHNGYMTPYEKLKSLPGAEGYLKENVSFAELDRIAYASSHTQFAEQMNKAKIKLFQIIHS